MGAASTWGASTRPEQVRAWLQHQGAFLLRWGHTISAGSKVCVTGLTNERQPAFATVNCLIKLDWYIPRV